MYIGLFVGLYLYSLVFIGTVCVGAFVYGSRYCTQALFYCMQGSGKTLAFGLPILQQLMLMKSESPEGTKTKLKALVLTPTRELALQVITKPCVER